MSSLLPWSLVLPPLLVGAGAVATGLVAKRRWRRRLLAFEHERRALSATIGRLESSAGERSKAEAATEAKSRFLATVTHEIRTPLSGILGMADLLLGTGLSREQQSYVQAIRSSGSALTLLVDEILDLSRIEAGKLDLVPEPFDLVDLVERTAELLAPRAHDRGLDLTVAIETGTPSRVEGDKLRLGQVLTNLISNAIKFTPEGGVELRVASDGEDGIAFQVTDTGIGVPPDRQLAIFEAYEQAVNGLDQTDEGTGLGLAISREIVSAMGGELNLRERLGGGSVFGFAVPLPRLVGSDLQRGEVSQHLGAALVVSPAPFLPSALAASLRAAGFDPGVVSSSAAASAAIRAERSFEVVVLDCALGETAVADLIRQVRSAGLAQILLCFSPTERRRFGQDLAGQADGWLVKPVRRSSIRDRIGSPAPRKPADGMSRARPGAASVEVLVADDDRVNAMLTRVALQKAGSTVTAVADGLAALAAVRHARSVGRPHDLVLLDLHMPGLSGFEVSRRLRRDERREGLPPQPIVAATASIDEDTRRRCREAGFDAVVGKPVTADVLGFAGRSVQARSASN